MDGPSVRIFIDPSGYWCRNIGDTAMLETIELAIETGAVTALVGQGIGPIADRRLRARAAAILPRVDFIALRDGVGSLALLTSMGVPAARVAVTGDDAIALGYRARKNTLGSAIGVNLRVSDYSGVGADLVAGFYVRLRTAIDDVRISAEATRLPLLDSARRQMALGEAAYRHLFECVESRLRTSRWSR